MKKIISICLAVLFTLGACSVSFAMEEGECCVVMGADLTAEQRAEIYQYFGVAEGSVTELTVTNKDERQYFEGKIADEKLGYKALSCIYIVATATGSGLSIETKNINYCTAEMYKNALTTAGITDANIKVCAPYPLSGTAALTGIYKAYETMTGTFLDSYAKDLGIEELIATGALAEYVGSDEALSIINDLKKILDETKDMPDDEVMDKIYEIGRSYDVELTEDQAKQIFTLCRMFEGLSAEEIQQRLVNMAKAAQKAQTFGAVVGQIVQSIGDFFASIGQFFSDVWNKWFGGGESGAAAE